MRLCQDRGSLEEVEKDCFGLQSLRKFFEDEAIKRTRKKYYDVAMKELMEEKRF